MASAVQGKVIDYGSAPYKNDPANTESFYVELEGSNQDKRTLWGVGIRDAIQLKNIQNGEEVTFYDRGLAEGSKKRNWDVERYEKPKEYVNSLEEGIERQTEKAQSSTVNMDKEEQPLQRGRFKDSEEEAELDLPESIKNQYIYKVKNRALAGEKVNFYDREGDDGAIAFEDRNKSLHTSREDSKTIKAMVDVAQAKNWSSIKIKGTEAFKREVWLEATVRGVEVKGYQPNEKDLIELEKRKEGRSYNQVIVNEERSREINAQNKTEGVKEELLSDAKNAGQAVAIDATLATAAGSDYTTSSAVASVVEDKLQNEVLAKITEEEVEATRDDVIETQESTTADHDIPDLDDKVWEQQMKGWEDEAERQIAEAEAKHEDDKANEMNSYQHIDTEYEKFKDERGLPPEYNGHSEEDLAEREHEESLEQAKAEEEAEIAFGKAEAEMEGFMNSPEFDNLDDYRAWKQADDEEKGYQDWKAEAMKEQEYELDDDRYRAEYAFAKSVEQEALVRSNEFDVGRDVDPETEVESDIEQFHDNLATVTGAGISADEARRRVEASFDKKISPTQRNEVKEDLEEKLSDKDKIAIEAWRRVVNVRFKDDPIKRQEKHDALDAKIPEILEGKYNLQPPVITEQQNIEVATKDRGSQDRAR